MSSWPISTAKRKAEDPWKIGEKEKQKNKMKRTGRGQRLAEFRTGSDSEKYEADTTQVTRKLKAVEAPSKTAKKTK